MPQLLPLQLVIVGAAGHLKQRLLALPLPDGISVLLEMCQTIQEPCTEQADIILFDGVPAEISSLSSDQFPHCLERILCAPFSVLEEMANRERFTGVWIASDSEQLLLLQYHQLLQSVEARKEQETNKVYLDTLIDSVPDLVWFKDLRGAHLKVNDAFCRAVGKSKQQCEGRGHYYIWDLEPDEYANGEYVCLETEEEVIRRGETCLFDEKVLSKNGLRQFKTYKSPLYNFRKTMFGTVGIAKDVTDLQNLSRELSVVLSSLPLATLLGDTENHIVYFNKKFCEYFNIGEKQLQSMTYNDMCEQLLGYTSDELDFKNMSEITQQREGGSRTFQIQQQTLKDIFGNHFGHFLLCLDVTTEHDLKQKIILSASTDFLTGLYNRRYFYEKILERAPESDISLVYFDLDNFKLVNDRYGHQIGDQVLVSVAEQLRQSFPDQLIMRMGGDEFIVSIFDNISMETLSRQVHSFIQNLTQKLQENPDFDFLSVSAGISAGTITDPGLDTLILRADEALYQSKSKGKGQFAVFTP